MIVKINKINYEACDEEFEIITPIPEYCNLIIRKNVSEYERIISLINECEKFIENLIIINTTHGGFIPINCSKIKNIFLTNTTKTHKDNIDKNIISHNIKNITINETINNIKDSTFIFSHHDNPIDIDFIKKNKPILLTQFNKLYLNTKIYTEIYKLTNTDLYIYIPNSTLGNDFKKEFSYFINNKELNYDNLIHLCIMVKNGGEQFASMLNDNLPIIDRWTILDTGSTDGTIDTIHKILVGKKKGNLYQEPFINFRDSRNRCLDLAGTSCKFCIMLDDTYVIKGDLRTSLSYIRGDQRSDSLSLMIKSYDSSYTSNRIIKSETKLRYIYTIHEIISDKNNINFVLSDKEASIYDRNYDYMEQRTNERQKMDLKLLYDEVAENKDDPRSYYYLAQTYRGLHDYEKAFYYYMKRTEYTNSGFIQERIDAAFEAARLAQYQLNKTWEECLQLYEKCFKIDETRPETQYFIGIYYYMQNNYKIAYKYFKKAFEIGFPQHCQFSLKPTLSFHFLPKLLSKICYEIGDFELGEQASQLFLQNNKPTDMDYEEVMSWYDIYTKLNIYKGKRIPIIHDKPIFCFVADGGFNKWSGININTTGVGGSETYIIEMARYIQQSGKFNVYVFCNCDKEDNFEGVQYRHLNEFFTFVNENYIHTCIVSRYSSYLPVAFKGYTENVYLVVHDLTPAGIVIPIDPKLKNVFCLTEWHVELFTQIYPSLKHLTVHFYYGIDGNFRDTQKNNDIQPFKFIYSSFPNRGLLPLLQMWPKIYEKQPLSTLHIYSDIDGEWVNSVAGEEMIQIKTLLNKYKLQDNFLGIHYHGWVNKAELAKSWLTADIWVYPCIFKETFCLTALEAAITKTLVITNDLAALQNTVGSRGVIIKGNPLTIEWQEKALHKIFKFMNKSGDSLKNTLVAKNFEWADSLSWENQANKLLNKYILQHNYEYKNVYSWDYPSEQQFIKVIEYYITTSKLRRETSQNVTLKDEFTSIKDIPNLQAVKILEVGTYTGISLINIVNLIPNSTAIAIDEWDTLVEFEIEESFHKNIIKAGLQDRVTAIKGDSYFLLMEMIKTKQFFDFIYVNRTHMMFDCYLDLILAFDILNIGGIMAIQEYKNTSIEEQLQSPYAGISHFIKKLRNKFKIIDNGHCLFIEKISHSQFRL
jgi:tetratricopeptide (TPR) repeat protein